MGFRVSPVKPAQPSFALLVVRSYAPVPQIAVGSLPGWRRKAARDGAADV